MNAMVTLCVQLWRLCRGRPPAPYTPGSCFVAGIGGALRSWATAQRMGCWPSAGSFGDCAYLAHPRRTLRGDASWRVSGAIAELGNSATDGAATLCAQPWRLCRGRPPAPYTPGSRFVDAPGGNCGVGQLRNGWGGDPLRAALETVPRPPTRAVHSGVTLRGGLSGLFAELGNSATDGAVTLCGQPCRLCRGRAPAPYTPGSCFVAGIGGYCGVGQLRNRLGGHGLRAGSSAARAAARMAATRARARTLPRTGTSRAPVARAPRPAPVRSAA